MIKHPVWGESVRVLLADGHGFAVYFYLLLLLGIVEFLALFLPSLDAQTWSGSAALFRISSATALVLVVYYSLRVANQEFAPWLFLPLRRWVRDHGVSPAAVAADQLGFLFCHTVLSVALCAPLLIWAGAIARTPLPRIGITLALLLFYAFSYGIWGLVTLALWERRAETRQVAIRSFFFAVVFVSALLYLPLNPVAFLLAYLGRQELPPLRLVVWIWPAVTVHFLFHVVLGAAGAAAHRWAVYREATL